jgi:hypothetical protein
LAIESKWTDILREGVQRKMRRDERDVMEEGPVTMMGRVVLEAGYHVVGDGGGDVVIGFIGGHRDRFVEHVSWIGFMICS